MNTSTQKGYNYLKTSDACVKCGKCLPTCTIFSITGDEATSPRGFIDLLGAYERKEIPLDKTTKNIFEQCFLCTNCVSVCPNTLPTDTLIENIRYEIAQKFGIAWFKRVFFYLLQHRKIMDFTFKLGNLFSPLLFKKISTPSYSLKPRCPLPMLQDRAISEISPKSFLNSTQEVYNPTSNTQSNLPPVALFIGCLGNYNYTQIGNSFLEIAKALGLKVIIPKAQVCCGAPPYFTGDFKTTKNLIIKNLEVFENILGIGGGEAQAERIVIPEATCAAMILEDWERFMQNSNEESYCQRIKQILPKISMATDFLYKHTSLAEILQTKPKSNECITYHDPCHARKVLGVYKEPRELLKINYDLVEMSDSNACCGFGGVSIQSERFALAKKVGSKKAAMIDKTQAKWVSAECSACRLQISNALYTHKVSTDFAHPLELIAKILKQDSAIIQ